MRYSSRLFLYAPFVILLVIATIAMLRWRHLAAEWQAKLVAANRGEEIAPGVTLHFASENVGGFPFNLDVVLDKFVLAVKSTRGPISLESEHFAIHALTYGRAQQIFEAAGSQVLTWTDTEGEAHRFAFVPGTMRASAIESNGRLARFDLDLDTFVSRSLTGARAQLHMRAPAGRDRLDFVVLADGLRPISGEGTLRHFELDGHMAPGTPLSALLSGRDEWRRALRDWRAANGTFRLERMDIDWDNAQWTGSGALALDDAHRLNGSVMMQVSGATQWKPTRLIAGRFTSALQDLASDTAAQMHAPLVLSLDIHNGAAILRARGNARGAGAIDPVF